jgi:hypothetical protein
VVVVVDKYDVVLLVVVVHDMVNVIVNGMVIEIIRGIEYEMLGGDNDDVVDWDDIVGHVGMCGYYVEMVNGMD